MKAAYYQKNGPARDVLIVGDRPTPNPATGEVLVAIHTSGVNPSDVKSRMGRPLAGDHVVPHSDGAGVIEAVGEGVPQARIGERVWIWNGQWQRPDGTAAEFICLPEQQAVQLPDNASFGEGACAGIPLLTAIQAVNYAKDLNAQTILVTGAGNSVGHYITQLAAQHGMRVIATASPRRAKLATDAGADLVIDYKGDDVAKRVLDTTDGGVDAIIDMDFSSSVELLRAAALKPHGSLICYGSNEMTEPAVPFRDLLFNSWMLKFFLVYELTKEQRSIALSQAMKLLSDGELVTEIDSRYPLEEIAAAHERVEQGTALGNVILELN